MAQYAGEAVGAVREIQSARAIIDEVMTVATAVTRAGGEQNKNSKGGGRNQ